ncbi:head-tail connector protein [Staphylococcus epidermidis]|uniref:head-tail connector protein n=1 Tax=Staphylococcus epidermidis TaxID=1282 RepID=UPI003DA2D195
MLIDDVKLALRITTDTFDSELNILIDSAKRDLGIAGVELPEELDSICKLAVITYCKIHFGNPDNVDFLQKSYDEQKSQLSMASGYTDWGNE